MKSIKNPEKTTYYICKNGDEITSYGVVEPNQTLNTGQPILESYLDKEEWEAELIKGGITLETQEEENE